MPAASLLARALALAPPPGPLPTPEGARCALTGEALTHGYPASAILPSSTGDPLDVLFGDAGGWLSPNAAGALSNDWNLGHRAIFQNTDGSFAPFYPRLSAVKEEGPAEEEPAEMSSKKAKLTARDAASPRPLWRDLVRDVWPARAGQPCLLLLATDPKKRVWYRARVGDLGETTPLYLFDNSRNEKRSLTVSWPRLVETLDFVEEAYAAGFTKHGIETFLPAETRTMQKVGLAATFAWEDALAALRGLPEFLVAVIIAQKATS